MAHLGSKDFGNRHEVLKAQRDNLVKGLYGDDIVKGKAAVAGEIREWSGKKYKKQPNGKWLEISESQGMTKKQHNYQANYSKEMSERPSLHTSKYEDAEKWHKTEASKLSDKEYTEEELSGSHKQSTKIETDGHGTHSVEHKGSKYWSKPDESKDDFAKRVKQAIKDDHKDDVEVEKGEESDIEKGGEGSRGGKVIGHTKSGKPIYDSMIPHKDHKHFETKEDYEEAASLLRDKQKKSSSAQKKYDFGDQAAYHERKAKEAESAKSFKSAKNKSITSFSKNDQIKLNKNHPYYDDFKDKIGTVTKIGNIGIQVKFGKETIEVQDGEVHEYSSGSIKKSEDSDDLTKAFETLGLTDLISK